MVLLPKGNPVKENVHPGKVNLPAALAKLQAGKFSGYLLFEFPAQSGVLIFENGRLISALLENGTEPLIAYDAIAAIFERSLAGQGRLNVYRLAPELARSVHALLHGDVLYQGQELKLIDIRALLAQMKEMAISGCLRIYTGDRVALIFYRDGTPLGFFHDGSTEIETTADTSLSVARLPGAKIDVLTIRGGATGMLADLMSADLAALWTRAQGLLPPKEATVAAAEPPPSAEVLEQQRRQRLLTLFQEIAVRHLGKLGASLVEKEFEKSLSGPIDADRLRLFYEPLGKAAKLLAGGSRIAIMLEEMDRQARGVLAGA